MATPKLSKAAIIISDDITRLEQEIGRHKEVIGGWEKSIRDHESNIEAVKGAMQNKRIVISALQDSLKKL